jgi:hypothetical protein
MKYFSTDVDIMRIEPMLFSEWNLSGEVVSAGAGGVVAGGKFTAANASFIAAGIEPGYVVYLSNAANTINNRFEIISVDSATQLTVSVARADFNDPPRVPAPATDINYRVCSYAAQANIAFHRLCARFAITPEEAETIDNIHTLSEASTYLTMSIAFSAIATRDAYSPDLIAKSEKYARAYLSSLEHVRFIVEIDGFLVPKSGGELYLTRD